MIRSEMMTVKVEGFRAHCDVCDGKMTAPYEYPNQAKYTATRSENTCVSFTGRWSTWGPVLLCLKCTNLLEKTGREVICGALRREAGYEWITTTQGIEVVTKAAK